MAYKATEGAYEIHSATVFNPVSMENEEIGFVLFLDGQVVRPVILYETLKQAIAAAKKLRSDQAIAAGTGTPKPSPG